MIYRYGEDYPTQCPPEEAIPPENLVLYRACCEEIVVDGVLNSNNFVPVWEQRNRKFPPHAECGAKAISFNECQGRFWWLTTLGSTAPLIGESYTRSCTRL